MSKLSAVILTRPIPFAAPFIHPQRRALEPQDQRRLMGWCEALVPGVSVELEEWVGADAREPLHAVVVSFPHAERLPVVLRMKVEEVGRDDLRAALCKR